MAAARLQLVYLGLSTAVEHSDSGNDSIHADESIFLFDSIGQFDKTDACTLCRHRLIITLRLFFDRMHN